MTIKPPDYRGVSWYIKFTPNNIRCAYIDIDSCAAFQRFPSQYWVDFVDWHAPGGTTYNRCGIGENGYKDLIPEHEVVGWDYGHDVGVFFGKKKPPTLYKIEEDVKSTIDSMLNSAFNGIDDRYYVK